MILGAFLADCLISPELAQPPSRVERQRICTYSSGIKASTTGKTRRRTRICESLYATAPGQLQKRGSPCPGLTFDNVVHASHKSPPTPGTFINYFPSHSTPSTTTQLVARIAPAKLRWTAVPVALQPRVNALLHEEEFFGATTRRDQIG